MYDGCHTSFDVMKEYLITGAELSGKYQFPELPAYKMERVMEDSVDFGESFSRKIKNHNKLSVNFYIDDVKFVRLWNSPDKYLDHLRCFHSVIQPDFSVSVGLSGMPFALNIFNKYRNHALGWYLHINGIPVIPSVGILDKDSYGWCFEGFPKNSVLSVCTNGRIRAKAARVEFCEGFKVMCETLEPTKVIIVGKVPDELNAEVPIINLKTRSQKINEKFGGQKNGINNSEIYEKKEG